MPTNVDFGSPFTFEVSRHRHDNSTTGNGEAAAWRMNPMAESSPLSALHRDFYFDDQESGKSSNLEETAPQVIRSRWAKNMTFPVDDGSALYFFYWCLNGGASATDIAESGVSSGIFETHFTGPSDLGTVYAFDAEENGSPATTDSTQNFFVQNIVIPRVELTVGGLESRLSVDMIGGGEFTANTGSPSNNSLARYKHLLPNHGILLSNGTTGYSGSYDTAAEEAFTAAPSGTNAIAQTALAATPTDFTSFLESITITGTDSFNLDASYNSSNVDADGAMIVEDQGWIRNGEGQNCDITMTFKTGPANITGLRSEYEDGTPRAWEYWLWHPTSKSSVYVGFRVSLGNCRPIPDSWQEGSNGNGHKTVTVGYRAQYDSSGSKGWHIAGSSDVINAALGA